LHEVYRLDGGMFGAETVVLIRLGGVKKSGGGASVVIGLDALHLADATLVGSVRGVPFSIALFAKIALRVQGTPLLPLRCRRG
jgi:hypothetical protein